MAPTNRIASSPAASRAEAAAVSVNEVCREVWSAVISAIQEVRMANRVSPSGRRESGPAVEAVFQPVRPHTPHDEQREKPAALMSRLAHVLLAPAGFGRGSLERVWELVGDPNRYPEWAGDIVEVTGLPRIARDATFRQVTRNANGTSASTFKIEELEDLRSIKMRCLDTNTYTRFVLTDAGGETFVDVETGTASTALRDKALDATKRKLFFRRLVNRMLDGLREAVARRGDSDASRGAPESTRRSAGFDAACGPWRLPA